MELQEIFIEVPDFRASGRKILIINLCAVLSGADDFEEITEYDRQKEFFCVDF
ncbi:MAG: transposase family protein [Bacteroidota bacterium]